MCLTVDTLASGALGVDGVIERTVAIQQSAHQPAFLPVRVFDAALALGKLGMRTGLSGRFGKEQWTAKALGTKAIGVLKRVGGRHA